MSTTLAKSTSSTFIAADYTTSADFQGWYLQTTPQPIICAATQTYYTSSSWADCSDSASSTPVPTGCDGSTLLNSDGTAGVCATYYSCSSYKIYPTEGSDESQAVLRYGCMVNWDANSIYRTLPARYVSSTAAPEKTDASASATTTKHTATNTGAQSTSTSTTASTQDSSSHGLSSGAIAGIVIGCVAALLIALIILFRKKIKALFGKGKPASDNGPAWSPVYMPPESESMSQGTYNLHTSEMSSDQQPNLVHEIGFSRGNKSQAVHELG